jgi:hypothetical protein
MSIVRKLRRAQATLARWNQMFFEILALLILPFFARLVLEITVTKESLFAGIKVTVLAVMFGILSVTILAISTDKRRINVLGNLHNRGFHWPVMYSASILYLAIACFTALFYFLNMHYDVITLEPIFPITQLKFTTLQDFFLWHFLDAIPSIDVPDTILFKIPYTYNHSLLGWLVLLFKVVVIIPMIASFTVSFKLIKQKDQRLERIN